MENNNIEQKESIKLMKMSKGYQWEIKIVEKKIDSAEITRLEIIDKELREKYGDDIKLNEVDKKK